MYSTMYFQVCKKVSINMTVHLMWKHSMSSALSEKFNVHAASVLLNKFLYRFAVKASNTWFVETVICISTKIFPKYYSFILRNIAIFNLIWLYLSKPNCSLGWTALRALLESLRTFYVPHRKVLRTIAETTAMEHIPSRFRRKLDANFIGTYWYFARASNCSI